MHNDRTYPTLCRLFDELEVATQETDMSMSVRDDDSGLEYAGARGIGGFFPSWSSLTRPRYLVMLAEIKRFHAEATRLLETSTDDSETLGSFVDRHGFPRYFADYFVTPLVAAVWSCPPGEAMRYPARYLFAFLEHHGMLSVFGSPTWRTVTGGSANYVEAILLRLDEVAVGAPVRGEGLPRHVGSRAALVPDVPTAADSFLMKGEEVPAHAHWGGNPAREQPLSERSV